MYYSTYYSTTVLLITRSGSPRSAASEVQTVESTDETDVISGVQAMSVRQWTRSANSTRSRRRSTNSNAICGSDNPSDSTTNVKLLSVPMMVVIEAPTC